jgi:hypothetical protein
MKRGREDGARPYWLQHDTNNLPVLIDVIPSAADLIREIRDEE